MIWSLPQLLGVLRRSKHAPNITFRCFHHHVFDTRLAVSLVDHMGLQIRIVEATQPMHILVVAQKLAAGVSPNNDAYVNESAQYRCASPFLSDQV
jgi:hypothetical protein